MSTTYHDLGTALYTLFNGINITGIYPGGWRQKANYPLKQIVGPFPAFSIYPAQDTEVALENVADDGTVTYWVYLYDSLKDDATAEGKMRRLVDLCRTRLRQERADATPLDGAAYTLDLVTGEWGFDIELGLRFYRFSIQAKTYEPLT